MNKKQMTKRISVLLLAVVLTVLTLPVFMHSARASDRYGVGMEAAQREEEITVRILPREGIPDADLRNWLP